MRDQNIIREVKTKWTHVYLREDLVVVTREMDDYPAETSAEVAKTILAAIDEVCDNQVYPMLSFFGDRKIGKEERSYYADHQNHLISHCAMMVSNPFQRMLASFFMGLNKVPVPSKVFAAEDKALEWLTLFKEKTSVT